MYELIIIGAPRRNGSGGICCPKIDKYYSGHRWYRRTSELDKRSGKLPRLPIHWRRWADFKIPAAVNQFPIKQKIGLKVTQVKKVNAGLRLSPNQEKSILGKAVILAEWETSPQVNVEGETELVGRGSNICSSATVPILQQEGGSHRRGKFRHRGSTGYGNSRGHVDMVSVTPLTGDPIMMKKLLAAKNITIYSEATDG